MNCKLTFYEDSNEINSFDFSNSDTSDLIYALGKLHFSGVEPIFHTKYKIEPKYRKLFTEKQLDTIHEIIHRVYDWDRCIPEIFSVVRDYDLINDFTPELINFFLEFFKMPEEKIDYILSITYSSGQYGLILPLGSPYKRRLNLLDSIEFVNQRNGVYYAVNNAGKKTFDFIDKPSRKQVKYQRVKNGCRTVFLSFHDWKEYLITEDELGGK